jgi:hypothetical protein
LNVASIRFCRKQRRVVPIADGKLAELEVDRLRFIAYAGTRPRKRIYFMTKFLLALGTAVLLAIPLSVQSAQSGPGGGNCADVRQAVATYGYAAARHYALIHYGKQAVAFGDRCLAGKYGTKGHNKYYKYHKH